MNDLNALEIATEKARRETAGDRLGLTNLVSNRVLERWNQERRRRASARLDDEYGLTDNAAPRRRRLRPFTVDDLESVMKSALETIRKIGLKMIPVYVSNLQTDFELRSVRRSIERSMDESFAEVKRQAATKLGNSGKTANKILDKAKKALGRAEIDVYRELQIESHNLRAKIARRTAPNREDRYTKTRIPEVSFMQQGVLREFATRTVEEACHCFDARAYIATAIMAGSAMETILLDALQGQRTTSTQQDLSECRLSDLIHLALKSGLLGQSTSQLTNWIRVNRDLVHPGRVLRQRGTVGREEAEMCLSILRLICKELRPASNRS